MGEGRVFANKPFRSMRCCTRTEAALRFVFLLERDEDPIHTFLCSESVVSD